MRSHARATQKDSNWKLSKPHQKALRQIYDKLNRTATDRYIGLFNVESLETRATGDDWKKQRKLTAEKRLEAIKIILREDGLASVFDMATKVKYPFALGNILAQAQGTALDGVILKIRLEESYQKMVIGYLAGFIEKEGIAWIEAQVDHFSATFTDQELVVFYLATECSPAIWDALKQRSPQLHALYWQTIFTGHYHPWFSNENNDAVIRHLNECKRYTTSLNQIYDEKRISPATVLETLKGYVTDNTETDKMMRSPDYLIRKLYKYLLAEKADPDQLHLLEWYYFRLLKKDHHEKSLITYLYPNLNSHPDFFARLVQFLYIPEEGDPQDEINGITTENVQGRAQNADAVLTDWSVLPGSDEQGQCDFTVLRKYFTDAIQHCADLKRKKHGTRELGKLLGRTEIPGSPWPHPEVCEIIEEYNSEPMNEGFFSGYYNRNAGQVHVRPATAPNDAESAEVSYLKELARKLGPKYPVTAKIITDIAGSKQHWVDFVNKRDRQDND